jgi:hypothetical protein
LFDIDLVGAAISAVPPGVTSVRAGLAMAIDDTVATRSVATDNVIRFIATSPCIMNDNAGDQVQ